MWDGDEDHSNKDRESWVKVQRLLVTLGFRGLEMGVFNYHSCYQAIWPSNKSHSYHHFLILFSKSS